MSPGLVIPTTGWINKLASFSEEALKVNSKWARCKGFLVWNATTEDQPNLLNIRLNSFGEFLKDAQNFVKSRKINKLNIFKT